MTDTIVTRRAIPGEAVPLAQLIADTFHDLPQSEWLVPDPIDRRVILSDVFGLITALATTSGAVYVDESGSKAVAVWLHMAPGFTPTVPDYDKRLTNIAGSYAERFQQFDAIRERCHPQDTAHHYLAFLAVSDRYQDGGYGSALLARYHAMLDQEGVPAYLEAASPRSMNLYRRHGYRNLGDPFILPDGTPMWPMWRAPNLSAAPVTHGHVSGG